MQEANWRGERRGTPVHWDGATSTRRRLRINQGRHQDGTAAGQAAQAREQGKFVKTTEHEGYIKYDPDILATLSCFDWDQVCNLG